MLGDESKRQDERGSTFICEIDAMQNLVSSAACPNCGRCELSVRESAGKRKGLASFLELYCRSDACTATVVSCTYTSSRVSPSCNGSEETSARGSARDSFAVNVKSVVAARAIGVGHEQLVRFCALLGAPKPVRRKTFTAIGKKVHAAENLSRARELTAAEAGSTNIAVMFDGTCQKKRPQQP